MLERTVRIDVRSKGYGDERDVNGRKGEKKRKEARNFQEGIINMKE